MRKIAAAFILFFLFSNGLIYSQPFIYHKGEVIDSSEGQQNSWFYSIKRFNLNNNIDEPFLYNRNTYPILTWDSGQNWLVIDFDNDLSRIYNTSDTLNTFELPDGIWGYRETFLYSRNKNNIYIFGNYLDEASVNPKHSLNTIDLSSHQIVNSIPINLGNIDNESQGMFFSTDSNLIYSTGYDSVSQKYQIITYSTISNQIVSSKDISQYGYPNTDVSILHKGIKGISTIESYSRDSKISYFRLYDIDKNTFSDFIIFNGIANPFLLNYGDKIILAETNVVNYRLIYNGELSIYDGATTKLLKKLTLPPGGEIYTFDKYPNMLYYYLESNNTAISLDINKLIPKYTLNIKTYGSGTVEKNPSQTEYDSSSTVTLTAKPSSGYIFKEWTGDITGTNASVSIVMNSNKNITAVFVR